MIRSHAAGVGKALTPQKTRMLLALRINVLAKGYSGISLKTLKQLIDAFNGKYLSSKMACLFLAFDGPDIYASIFIGEEKDVRIDFLKRRNDSSSPND